MSYHPNLTPCRELDDNWEDAFEKQLAGKKARSSSTPAQPAATARKGKAAAKKPKPKAKAKARGKAVKKRGRGRGKSNADDDSDEADDSGYLSGSSSSSGNSDDEDDDDYQIDLTEELNVDAANQRGNVKAKSKGVANRPTRSAGRGGNGARGRRAAEVSDEDGSSSSSSDGGDDDSDFDDLVGVDGCSMQLMHGVWMLCLSIMLPQQVRSFVCLVVCITVCNNSVHSNHNNTGICLFYAHVVVTTCAVTVLLHLGKLVLSTLVSDMKILMIDPCQVCYP